MSFAFIKENVLTANDVIIPAFSVMISLMLTLKAASLIPKAK